MTVAAQSTTSTPDPSAIAEQVRRFVETVIIPAEGHDLRLSDTVRHELQHAAKAAGVFAPHVAPDLGGLGLRIAEWSPVFQAAGYSPWGPSALNCMAPDEGNMHLLALLGNAEQRERYLAPLAVGDRRSCFAMTEPHPGAGSDPSALMTEARRVSGGWEITGRKRFISGADGATFCIVVARTGMAIDRVTATLFIVDMTSPGVVLGPHIPTSDQAIVGGHCHVAFEQCRVGDDAVLGVPNEGLRHVQARLGPARLTHCMRWLGLARRALDIALDRVEGRELFGARLRDLGLAQQLIAQSVIDIETADSLITKAAGLLAVDPKAANAISSVAKVHCSEVVCRVIDNAIQLCGGDGVSRGLPLIDYLNEVRPFRIYDGPNETHRFAIARRASKSRRLRVSAGAPSFAATLDGSGQDRPADPGGIA